MHLNHRILRFQRVLEWCLYDSVSQFRSLGATALHVLGHVHTDMQQEDVLPLGSLLTLNLSFF